MNYRALCFVDMPFGQKSDLKSGVLVDFDQIYNEAIKPAIEQCGLDALLTETGGNLKKVLQKYIDNGGALAAQFTPYMLKLGHELIGSRQEFRRSAQARGH